MTSDEADQRILVSRRTLLNFKKMLEVHDLPHADLALFENELSALEGIANEHPGKTQTVIVLVTAWVRLRERIRGKVH